MAQTRKPGDYKVAWICPLEVEQIAAMEMLDEVHDPLPKSPADHNVYSLGRIHVHNVVIAGLPRPGNCSAATVVAQMRMTFPNLRFGLLVGIGGGVPVKTADVMIRLGHVVVSEPAGVHSGALQYDHGKAKDGHFERTGVLALPPTVLLNAAQKLAVRRARLRDDPVQQDVRRIDTTLRGLRRFEYPGAQNDHLFLPSYVHQHQGAPCATECDPSKRIPRDSDDDGKYVVVHRGNIASGELVVRDALLRDKLAQQDGLLCFEMEAAGTIADFPCLVIRGISDYCDSHKNDMWHGYAAAVAAAYARQLFFDLPEDEIQRLEQVSEVPKQDIPDMSKKELRAKAKQARLLIERREFEAGAELLQEVVDIEKDIQFDSDDRVENLCLLQWAWWETGDRRQAEYVAKEAHQILEITKGIHHVKTMGMLHDIADNLLHQARGHERHELLQEEEERKAGRGRIIGKNW